MSNHTYSLDIFYILQTLAQEWHHLLANIQH